MTGLSGSSGIIELRGYVSQFANRDDTWPPTYVIVRTEPDWWMATLPLEEVVDVLDGVEGVSLRGIPHRWEDDKLVVELGPVHLFGTGKEWRNAARALLDVAGDAGGLYEAPGTRPWSGSPSRLGVSALTVEDDALVGRWRPDTTRAELAAAGGFTEDEFERLFGLGWAPAPHCQETQVGLFADRLYLWGTPAQLAAATSPDGLRIGLPGGEWRGPGEFVPTIEEPVTVNSGVPTPMIESFVRDLLRRRRRSFTWCRHCGDLLVPEVRHDRETCYGCASVVLGVVY